MDSDTALLLQAMFNALPEERKKFWKDLEEEMVKAGLTPGFYCPYIPLQHVGIKDEQTKREDT